MNKKLTTILLAVLIILIGKVDAATLTQKIGEGYIRSTVVEGQEVTIKFVSNKYTFSSWTVESGNVSIDTTNPVVTFTMPSSNVIIKANYEGETVNYTISYNANGGTGTMTAQTVEAGEEVALSTNAFTKSGYTFKGWSEDSSATTATYTDGQSITPTTNMTLYAVWEQTANTITLTYDANGGTNAPEAQTYTGTNTSYTFTISTVEPIPPSGKAFRGWSTSSSATVADYKIGASITISSNTTLYAVYVTPLSSGDLFTGSDLGAYVTYTPSSTSYTVSTSASGYTSDQTYNPSSYTNWRVFSNDGTNVEIISDESVGDLYLQGEIGYVNAVQTLQDMSAAYVNSTYVTSARSLGYSEEGLTDVANYKTIDTDIYPIENGIDDTAFPYTDTQYSADITVISNNGSLGQKREYAWLASRRAYASSSCSYFFVSYMYSNGTCYEGTLDYLYRSDIARSETNSYGVRPIVTLKSSLTVASGDGSPSNPYILAEPVLSSVVSVGDYITYTPSSTSYTVSTSTSGYTSAQTYNPSSTTSWRVFSINDDTVEIISTDSVGDLSLSGDTGYVNAVQTLQDMAAAYVNSTYATSGRSLGYSESGLTEEEIANYKTIDTATYPVESGVSNTFPYSDTQYTADETVLSNHGSMYNSSGRVWFASRYAYTNTDPSYSYFRVRSVYSDGTVAGNYYMYYDADGAAASTYINSSGVRPIISLKSGIKITSGSGTSTAPYIITN